MEPASLRRLDNRPVPPSEGEIRAFLLVRDEIQRLPFTLAHHRTLGVHRFLVIDNASSDGTVDYLLGEPDVHVFTTDASYQSARNGTDWLETLLHVYGDARWCLLLDADEALVYPDCGATSIPTFCRKLGERGLNCLATLFVDMYSDRPIAQADHGDRCSLLQSYPYFDSTGYHPFPSAASCMPRFYGGPRARLFWPEIDLAGLSDRVRRYVERAFDEQAYLAAYQDVAAAISPRGVKSALDHYQRFGHVEGRTAAFRPVDDWPEDGYLASNPDVREGIARGTFGSGLEHFVKCGQFEGRLLWHEGPPCMSQVPLVRWQKGMRLGVGRHGLNGGTWRRSDAVGGALLHFKLTADLAGRAEVAVDDRATRTLDWAQENQRYLECLGRDPRLSAMWPGSVLYRDAHQLVELGIVTPLSSL